MFEVTLMVVVVVEVTVDRDRLISSTSVVRTVVPVDTVTVVDRVMVDTDPVFTVVVVTKRMAR